ncbi:dde superfamily endonuclease [Holotrichia oblita]|nr:dde superfamily endonuclease [Holotrichia oblita]
MANPGDFLLLINEIIIDERRQELRLERKHLRDTSNPFTLPNTIFRQIYRIPKHLTEELGNIIIPYMRDNIREVISIPNNLKIFIALQFFGYGSYQKITGQDYHTPMSQASVSRCLTDVITALEHLSHLISFPTTQEQCTIEKQRKGYYSLNVQIICNSKLRILAINARFPGSVHDSAIWQTSQIRATLQRMYQEGNTNSWLLGDSGYPLEPWLMTPINAPQNITEQNYNRGEWGKMPPLTFK